MCCTLSMIDVYAAPQNKRPEPSEQMQAMQKLKIDALVEALDIAAKKKKAFTEIYIQYDNAVNEAGRDNVRPINGINRIDPDLLTQEQVKESILAQLELSRELIEIKSTYFEKFNSILTPKQMLEFFRTESAISNRIKQEFKRRVKPDKAPPVAQRK